MNSWELSFYNNFNSSIIIIVMVLLNGEIPVIWNHRNELSLSFFLWTALGMFGGEVSWVAGIVGLFVGITTQLQIKYTSSLSHNISGVAKNCIQTFMGAAIYRTPLTFTGVCGVLLVVGGSFTYTLERIRINSQTRSYSLETGSISNSFSDMKNEVFTVCATNTERFNSFQQMSVCSIDRPLRSRSAGKDPSWT